MTRVRFIDQDEQNSMQFAKVLDDADKFDVSTCLSNDWAQQCNHSQQQETLSRHALLRGLSAALDCPSPSLTQ